MHSTEVIAKHRWEQFELLVHVHIVFVVTFFIQDGCKGHSQSILRESIRSCTYFVIAVTEVFI